MNICNLFASYYKACIWTVQKCPRYWHWPCKCGGAVYYISEASVKFAYKAGFTQRLFITLESKSVHLKPPGMLMVGQTVVPLAEEWQCG